MPEVTTDTKAQALAAHLDVLADEIRQDADNNYTVSPRPAKRGTKPAQYVQDVADLKSILTPKEREEFSQAIESARKGELNKTERDAIYYKIRDRINDRIEKTEAARKRGDSFRAGLYSPQHLDAIERLKKSALYVENVLFHLLEQNDGSGTARNLEHAKSLRTAWNGETPEDKREDYEDNAGEYIVLTDSEADEMAKDYGQNVIDEIVLPEIPERYHQYIDMEKLRADYADTSERGAALASYDGHEIEQTLEGETFYIYRTN